MSSRYDHVFTSGGVGPTHDDVTMAAMAKAFGLRPARNLELEAKIRSAMGPNLHERDLRMADIPDGARLLYGPDGDRSRWPVVAVKNVYILPGVPEIFRYKFAMVRELFRPAPSSVARSTRAKTKRSSRPPSTRWWPSFPAWRSAPTLGSAWPNTRSRSPSTAATQPWWNVPPRASWKAWAPLSCARSSAVIISGFVRPGPTGAAIRAGRRGQAARTRPPPG
jgi:hypothetical protein